MFMLFVGLCLCCFVCSHLVVLHALLGGLLALLVVLALFVALLALGVALIALGVVLNQCGLNRSLSLKEGRLSA